MENENENSLGEDQLGFLSEMLNEPTSEVIDPEIVTEVQESIEESVKEVEDLGTAEQIVEAESQEADQPSEVEQTILNLRAQILAMSNSMNVDPLVQKVQTNVAPEVVTDPSVNLKTTLENFLSAEELDRLIDEPALINTAFQRFQSNIAQTMTSTIQQEVNKQILINRAVTDFYQSNADLLPYANFVKFVMTEVESANRDKPYSEIFQTTATECRKRLGLSITPIVTRETNKGSQKPAFVGSKRGNSRPASSPAFFDPAAADMMNLRD